MKFNTMRFNFGDELYMKNSTHENNLLAIWYPPYES